MLQMLLVADSVRQEVDCVRECSRISLPVCTTNSCSPYLYSKETLELSSHYKTDSSLLVTRSILLVTESTLLVTESILLVTESTLLVTESILLVSKSILLVTERVYWYLLRKYIMYGIMRDRLQIKAINIRI